LGISFDLSQKIKKSKIKKKNQRIKESKNQKIKKSKKSKNKRIKKSKKSKIKKIKKIKKSKNQRIKIQFLKTIKNERTETKKKIFKNRHQLATSTETVGTKKKLHSDFPYMVKARNYWDGMGKGSVGDSISCVLMEVFSPVELSNSSISGEGNGTKLQKLDPQRISALIGLFIFYFLSFFFFLFKISFVFVFSPFIISVLPLHPLSSIQIFDRNQGKKLRGSKVL